MIVDAAEFCLHVPYIWGGKNPLTGFDCSGLVEWCLKSIGMDPPGVNNSVALYRWLINGAGLPMSVEPQRGDLVFYGKSVDEIYHVEIMRNKYQTIGACSGDSFTLTVNDARSRGACVRINPLGYRKDQVAIIRPNYPSWVLEK